MPRSVFGNTAKLRVPGSGGALGTIRDVVADSYKVSPKDILGPSKERQFAWPRKVAMYMARRLTDRSYPDIGRAFGGRHHTTAMHSDRAVRAQIERSAEIRTELRAVEDAARAALGLARLPTGGGAIEDSKGREVPEW